MGKQLLAVNCVRCYRKEEGVREAMEDVGQWKSMVVEMKANEDWQLCACSGMYNCVSGNAVGIEPTVRVQLRWNCRRLYALADIHSC